MKSNFYCSFIEERKFPERVEFAQTNRAQASTSQGQRVELGNFFLEELGSHKPPQEWKSNIFIKAMSFGNLSIKIKFRKSLRFFPTREELLLVRTRKQSSASLTAAVN